MTASANRRFRFLCAPLVSLVSLLPLQAPARAGEVSESTPRRLLLYLPEGEAPLRNVPYRSLRGLAALGAPVDGADRLPRSKGVAELLARHGAVALASLDDGLAEAPPEWQDWYVVAFAPPLSGHDARALASAVVALAPRLRARAEAVYEPLAVEELFRPAAAGPRGGATRGAESQPFPNDPLFVDGSQWGLHNDGSGPFSTVAGLDVRALGAWAITTGNTAVRVGALDTGVDDTHPDLVATLADGTPRLYYKDEVSGDGSGGKDTHYHGTSVLGVFGALTNNGASLGGLGAAGVIGGSGGDSTGSRLFSVKITFGSSGGATDVDMARGIVNAYLAGARVVNLSFAADEISEVVRTAMAFVAERGTIVVCGAGNTANSQTQYPGAFNRFGFALSVGAMAPDGTLADFSTRGDQIDVVAPGQDVVTTWLTYANDAGSPIRNYQAVSGTSFAAPFVTGALGLAATLDTGLVANDFQEIVRRTARDWGDAGRDTLYGSGLLDVEALVTRLVPPHALRRGTAEAESWVQVARESLLVVDSGIRRGGVSVDGAYAADVWEVRAPVTDLLELLETPEAWGRFTGPGGWSPGRTHEFDYGWSELLPGSLRPDGFELRTYAYFVDQPPAGCPSCPSVGWLPRPPAEMRLDWTAWARFDAPPTVTILEPAPDAVWTRGETRTVRWQASDPDRVSRVEIAWLAEGSMLLLASSPDSSGTTEVVVPCGTGSGTAELRVTAYDDHGPAHDESSAVVPVQLSGEVCAGASFVLASPRPNPARGAVRFPYWLSATSGATRSLRILDARGREIAQLPLDTLGQPAEVVWNGLDSGGAQAPSGIYWAILEGAGGPHAVRFAWLR